MQRKKWHILSLLLICTFLVSLIVPASVSAAQKKHSKKVLVVYFSATGTTKEAAKKVKKATNGTLYKITAQKKYTKKDLDYTNDNCRANKEQQNSKARPKIKGRIKNIRKYDIIFVGYPIWWGKEPKIIHTFLESYNLKGKIIIPFCTSGGSGISGSIRGIKSSAKGAKVKSGKDLTDSSYRTIKNWVKKKL